MVPVTDISYSARQNDNEIASYDLRCFSSNFAPIFLGKRFNIDFISWNKILQLLIRWIKMRMKHLSFWMIIFRALFLRTFTFLTVYISLSFCTSFKKCWKLKSVLSFLFLINKSFDLFIVIAVKKVFIIGRVWSSLKPDSVVLYYLIWLFAYIDIGVFLYSYNSIFREWNIYL